MATKRKPLPYAAETLRMEAVAELKELRAMLREGGIAAARGDASVAIRIGFEALDRTDTVIDLLRQIPEARN